MRHRSRNQRLVVAAALIGCLGIARVHSADADRRWPQAPASNAAAVVPVIDWNVVHQTMDGFGASDAFLDVALTDAQADLYFSTSAGIGLSYLRMGIANGGGLNGGAWSDATKAAARGAKVWAAPWTAPAAWKDNNSTSNGGHLCAAAGQGTCTGSHYADWANRLADFAGLLQTNAGVGLYAVSVQNEPDYTASYDSMLVSDSEFVDFVNVLGPKLAALSPRPRLIVGDYSNWNLLWSMVGGIEANPSALSHVDVYAAHQYWGVSAYHPGRPRPLWQTEMSSFDAFDPGIANGVTVAKWIHSAITDGNVTAWHYWWLYNPYNPTNEGLIGYPGDRNAPTKRLYTLGNFSRFVRPGWQRIDVGNGFGANLFVSAYRNAPTGDFAIVVVNDSGGNLPLATALAGMQTTTVTPWVTSATLDLQAQAPVNVVAGQLSASVAYGVTTFIGRNDRIFGAGFE